MILLKTQHELICPLSLQDAASEIFALRIVTSRTRLLVDEAVDELQFCLYFSLFFFQLFKLRFILSWDFCCRRGLFSNANAFFNKLLVFLANCLTAIKLNHFWVPICGLLSSLCIPAHSLFTFLNLFIVSGRFEAGLGPTLFGISPWSYILFQFHLFHLSCVSMGRHKTCGGCHSRYQMRFLAMHCGTVLAARLSPLILTLSKVIISRRRYAVLSSFLFWTCKISRLSSVMYFNLAVIKASHIIDVLFDHHVLHRSGGLTVD